MLRRAAAIALTLATLVVPVVLAGCGDGGGTTATVTASPPGATTGGATTATERVTISTAADATTATAPSRTSVTVYFATADGQDVVAERRPAPAGAPLRGAMEGLAGGPEGPGLIPALPAGTRVLSVDKDGSVATVDLSREFEEGYPQGSAAEIATIAPIVYTATAVPGVSAVRITVEGRAPQPVGGQFDLSVPVSRGDLPDMAGASP